MSTSNPSPNQDHLAAAAAPGSRVRITVLTIAALHVVVIGGLLIQGCDKKGAQSAGPSTPSTSSSNLVGSLPSLGDSRYYQSPPPDSGTGPGTGTPAPSTSAAHTPSAPDTGIAAATPSTGIPPLIPTQAPPAQTPAPETAAATTSAPGAGTTSTPAPAPAPATTPAPAAVNPGEHIVKQGDLIGELAKKYGVTAKAILDANPGVNPRNLRVESKLAIPSPTPKAPPAAKATPPGSTPESPDVYVVKPGDTLAKIAKKHGITVNQLRTANRIKGDRIIPNQRLSIPTKSVPASTPGTGDGPA